MDREEVEEWDSEESNFTVDLSGCASVHKCRCRSTRLCRMRADLAENGQDRKRQTCFSGSMWLVSYHQWKVTQNEGFVYQRVLQRGEGFTSAQ